MKVVVEGERSKSVTVESGVPQGTVLGPLMFLCHINDLPDVVQSQVRLFADDCLLHRQIKSNEDHVFLHKDLTELEIWASRWGMRFNAKKCYVMSIRNTSSHLYQLDNTILQQVSTNPYLGITLSVATPAEILISINVSKSKFIWWSSTTRALQKLHKRV